MKKENVHQKSSFLFTKTQKTFFSCFFGSTKETSSNIQIVLKVFRLSSFCGWKVSHKIYFILSSRISVENQLEKRENKHCISSKEDLSLFFKYLLHKKLQKIIRKLDMLNLDSILYFDL